MRVVALGACNAYAKQNDTRQKIFDGKTLPTSETYISKAGCLYSSSPGIQSSSSLVRCRAPSGRTAAGGSSSSYKRCRRVDAQSAAGRNCGLTNIVDPFSNLNYFCAPRFLSLCVCARCRSPSFRYFKMAAELAWQAARAVGHTFALSGQPIAL